MGETRFRTELVNPPWEDPGLLLHLPNQPGTLLVDCGDLSRLGVGALQKIRWVFVSHTHIDHFIGFDTVLRMQLFSTEPLAVVGPQGILEQVAHKLQGYAWNLVDTTPFEIAVFETDGRHWRGRRFHGRHQFRGGPVRELTGAPDCHGLSLRAHPVRHGVPCLAFRLDEPPRFQFQMELAHQLGLPAGAWIEDFKQGRPVQTPFAADLEALRPRLLKPLPAFSLGYLTDTELQAPLLDELTDFFKGVEQLWCEAAFLDEHAGDAQEKMHMTTSQAARLAARAGAGRLHIFHQSRRYPKTTTTHLEEVGREFERVREAPVRPRSPAANPPVT